MFAANISGRPNLWKVAAAGGWPVQLIQSDERQANASWSPDGKWIVFQQDSGGNELWDIYAVPSGGGALIDLTATPEISEDSPLWSPDGKTIALDYKLKQAASYDLALLDFATRKVRKLTHEASRNHNWNAVAWSPDGKTLYANRTDAGFTDGGVYAVDVAAGSMVDLTPHRGATLYLASSLSPDGRMLLITSNERGGNENSARVP